MCLHVAILYVCLFMYLSCPVSVYKIPICLGTWTSSALRAPDAHMTRYCNYKEAHWWQWPLSLGDGEREGGGEVKGGGRREAVDEVFLRCSTASDTDLSVNKSFTLACIQTLFRYRPLSSFPSYCMPSSSPSALHSHVYRAITGCNAQVRSWPPTSCRAKVDSGHIFLCLVFSAFYLSGLSCGTLKTMSQHRASHTNRRHSCVFWTCSRQASNWTRENICSKYQSFVSVTMSSSSVLLQTKHTAVYLLWFSHTEEH